MLYPGLHWASLIIREWDFSSFQNMTQGILIITGFNVSFYVSVKSGISLGFKLVYWVTVHLQHRYKCSLIWGIKGPKLLLQVQVSCSQEEQRNWFFFFFTLKTARLPVTLGSILLKVKQLVWKMHQEMCHSLLTTSAFSPTLHVQNKTVALTDLCNPHTWLNVCFKISELIGWFIVIAFIFLHSNRDYYLLSACFFILEPCLERTSFP